MPGGSEAGDTVTVPAPGPGPVPSCPAGTQSYDPADGACVGQEPEVTCPEGGSPAGDTCIAIPSPGEACPEGYETGEGSICQAEPTSIECEEGFEYDTGDDRCEAEPTGTVTCPAGATYFDEGSGKCIAAEECPPPGSFEDGPETDCEADPVCPEPGKEFSGDCVAPEEGEECPPGYEPTKDPEFPCKGPPPECPEGYEDVGDGSVECETAPGCPPGFEREPGGFEPSDPPARCVADPVAPTGGGGGGGGNDSPRTTPTEGGEPTGDNSATVRGRLALAGGGTARAAQASDLAGFEFFIDYNFDGGLDGSEPRGLSDAAGNWIIAGVIPGTYPLVQSSRAGFRCVEPPDCAVTMTFEPGQMIDVVFRSVREGGPPVRGEAVQVREQSGEVLIKLPPGTSIATRRNGRTVVHTSQSGFIPIERVVTIPMRSIIETTRGAARVSVAQGRRSTRIRTIVATAGRFQILQGRRGSSTAELRLNGGGFRSRCEAASKAQAAGSRRSVRRLRTRTRGRRRGSFRTRGRYSSATVRGTNWITTDRCDGTMTSVRRGVVSVRDFTRDRTVRVAAGARYLARRSR